MTDVSGIDLDSLAKRAMATPDTSNLDRLAKEASELRKKQAAETDPVTADIQKELSADQASVKKSRAAEQPFDVQPWKQKQPEPDPLTAFGSLGSVFAVLASTFTHQPFVNSLNASAAAMNAARANDLSAYKDAYQAWKDNTQLALDRHRTQHEDFQDAIQELSTDTAAGSAKLRALAAKYGDQFTAMKVEAGMYDDVIQRQQAADSTAIQLAQVFPTLKQKGDLIQGGMELLDARKKLNEAVKTGDQAAITNAQDGVKQAEQKITDLQSTVLPSSRTTVSVGSKLSDETLDQMADQYLAGDKSVLQGLGFGNVGSQNRASLREKITQKMKDAGMSGADIATKIAEFSGLTAGERSLGTRTAQMGMAVNEAKQMSKLVLDASSAFPRSEFVPLNKAEQAVAAGTGNTNIVRFTAAVNSFVNAYARAVSPTGTPTVHDKEHAREILSTAMTQDQVKAVMDQLGKEMEAASKAPGATMQEFRDRGGQGFAAPPSANPAASPSQGANDPLGIR